MGFRLSMVTVAKVIAKNTVCSQRRRYKTFKQGKLDKRMRIFQSIRISTLDRNNV